MHSGLHQAKLENVPHLVLELVASVRPVYEVKFNLREQPAFQRPFRPGEGGIRGSLQSLIPEGSARKEDREIHC